MNFKKNQANNHKKAKTHHRLHGFFILPIEGGVRGGLFYPPHREGLRGGLFQTSANRVKWHLLFH